MVLRTVPGDGSPDYLASMCDLFTSFDCHDDLKQYFYYHK